MHLLSVIHGNKGARTVTVVLPASVGSLNILRRLKSQSSESSVIHVVCPSLVLYFACIFHTVLLTLDEAKAFFSNAESRSKEFELGDIFGHFWVKAILATNAHDARSCLKESFVLTTTIHHMHTQRCSSNIYAAESRRFLAAEAAAPTTMRWDAPPIPSLPCNRAVPFAWDRGDLGDFPP